jgi:hypothetical protein
MAQISPYIFEMFSEPAGLTIDAKTNPRTHRRIYFKDSIFKFFPMGEYYMYDPTGIISDTFYFLENAKFNIKLGRDAFVDQNGNELGGYLENTYIWAENEVNDTKISKYLSGTNVFLMLDLRFTKDRPQARAFKDTISNIAKSIAMNDFGFSDLPKEKKIYISDTSSTDTWYQGPRDCRDFLEQTLCRNAYNPSSPHPESPFSTFINCRGQFYFMSYYDMFNQTPVAKFILKTTSDNTLDPFAIQDIDKRDGGILVNYPVYKQNVFYINEDGTIGKSGKPEELNIIDQTIKMTSQYKPLIYDDGANVQTILDFGLKELTDIDNFIGRQNITYQDTNVCNRVGITIQFHPYCVAGKTVEIEICRSTDNDHPSLQYSGNWLILESEHYMDIDMAPYTRLLLGRGATPTDKNYAFINELVKGSD